MPLDFGDSYGLPTGSTRKEVTAPVLPYAPRDPLLYRPGIAIVGCGGIGVQHMRAYSAAGYSVVALCDVHQDRAAGMRDAYFPGAEVSADWRSLLGRSDIEVVDLAAHPAQRAAMYEPLIDAGKHILSQKPFVTDLDFGLTIVEKASRKGVRLAVNQNGRWAPHWSWIRHAVHAGLLGEVNSASLSVHWNHNWIKGSVFDEIPSIVLYDFGIHWFDILGCLLAGKRPVRVYASTATAAGQTARPPLLAQVAVEYESAQASLVFNANTLFGEQDVSVVSGTKGTARSFGPDLNAQSVILSTADGMARPELAGAWFPDGFHGTMAELLCSIEEDREPINGARDNLESLALCFAAVASARRHEPVSPWSVRKLPE